MMRLSRCVACGLLLLGAGCAPQNAVPEEPPMVLAEPFGVEPIEPCEGGDPDDGIGGTGCEPMVARQLINPSE
ncbi:MAG: hypothetical protein AAF748_14135 [Pseudomonadota bacterium]